MSMTRDTNTLFKFLNPTFIISKKIIYLFIFADTLSLYIQIINASNKWIFIYLLKKYFGATHSTLWLFKKHVLSAFLWPDLFNIIYLG